MMMAWIFNFGLRSMKSSKWHLITSGASAPISRRNEMERTTRKYRKLTFITNRSRGQYWWSSKVGMWAATHDLMNGKNKLRRQGKYKNPWDFKPLFAD